MMAVNTTAPMATVMIALTMIAAAMADGDDGDDDDDLSGDDVGTYLQAMQVIDGPLRVRGGGKDRALIAPEYLQPRADIGGMIRPVFELQAEIGTHERRAEFGNQFFLGVTDIAIALLFEAAIKPRWMTSPVNAFMTERGVIALRVKERIERRHEQHEVMQLLGMPFEALVFRIRSVLPGRLIELFVFIGCEPGTVFRSCFVAGRDRTGPAHIRASHGAERSSAPCSRSRFRCGWYCGQAASTA